MPEPGKDTSNTSDTGDREPALADRPDPARTDHPAGEEQAARNVEDESPG